KNDIKLVEGRQTAAVVRGGDFRDIDRCRHRGDPHGDPPYEAEKGKAKGLRGQAGSQGRDNIEDPHPEQGLLSAQGFSGDAPENGTQYGAPKGHGHDEDAVESEWGVAQKPIGAPKFLNGLVGP